MIFNLEQEDIADLINIILKQGRFRLKNRKEPVKCQL